MRIGIKNKPKEQGLVSLDSSNLESNVEGGNPDPGF